MNKQSALDALYEKETQRLKAYAQTAQKAGEYSLPVFGHGNASSAKLVFIGEAPGAEETKLSMPFVGKAGKQFDSLLESAGIVRSDTFVTNTVKYRPITIKPRSVSNRTPSRKEVEASLPLLKQELIVLQPRVIITLGNTPLSAMQIILTLEKQSIGDVHGRAQNAFLAGEDVVLFPLYHPASCIYNRSLLEVLSTDALALGELVKTI